MATYQGGHTMNDDTKEPTPSGFVPEKSFYNTEWANKMRNNLTSPLYKTSKPPLDIILDIHFREIAWGHECDQVNGRPKIMTALNGYEGLGETPASVERDILINDLKIPASLADRLVTDALLNSIVIRGLSTQQTPYAKGALKEVETNLLINGIGALHGFNTVFVGDLVEMYIPTQAELKKVDWDQMRRLGVVPGKVTLWARSYRSDTAVNRALDALKLYLESPDLYHKLFSSDYCKNNCVQVQFLCNLVYFILFCASTGIAKGIESGLTQLASYDDDNALLKAFYLNGGTADEIQATVNDVWAHTMGITGLYELSKNDPNPDGPTSHKFDGRVNQLLSNAATKEEFNNAQRRFIRSIVESIAIHPELVDDKNLIGWDGTTNLARVQKSDIAAYRDLDLTKDWGLAQRAQTEMIGLFLSAMADFESLNRSRIVGQCTKAGGGPNNTNLEYFHRTAY